MQNYRQSILLGLLATICLSSCTSYEESFSSEPGVGSGWKSMSETYVLGHANDQQTTDKKQTQKSILPLAVSYTRDTEAVQMDVLYCTGQSQSIERRPEAYLRVWVTPHQDTQGNMVEGYYVRSRMKQGQWVITSAGSSGSAEQNWGASS